MEESAPINDDVIASVSPAEASRRVRAKQARLIDVRGPAEFASFHAKGAENVPLYRIHDANLETGSFLFICLGGSRSADAVEMLRSTNGNVAYVQGGMQAWSVANLPMVRRQPSRRWRIWRNIALGSIGVSILLAMLVKRELIGIAGLIGAVVVVVMMIDQSRWRLSSDKSRRDD